MDLNQFSTVDIVLDKANDNFIQKQTISAGDRDGRSLTLQVTDAGSIGEVPGLTANLLWTNHSSGVSDLSAFSVVDRTTSVFKIDYPQNMLTAGKVTAQIQLLHNGKVTHSKKFEIIVLDIAGKLKGVLQTAEYTALVEALAKTNEFETDIAEVSAQLAQKANKTEVDLKISQMQSGVKGTYASLTALQTALPNGDTGNYVVSENGHIYNWNNGTWVDTGIQYQSTGIAKNSVTPEKTDFLAYQLVTTEVISGSYYNSAGNLLPAPAFSLTKTITLKYGETLKVNARGYLTSVSVISLLTSDGKFIKTGALSVDSSQREYTYTATEQIEYAVVSFQNAGSLTIEKFVDIVALKDDILNKTKNPILKPDSVGVDALSFKQMSPNSFNLKSLQNQTNKFLAINGAVVTQNGTAISHPVKVKSGDVVKITHVPMFGPTSTGNIFKGVVKSEQGGNLYVIGASNDNMVLPKVPVIIENNIVTFTIPVDVNVDHILLNYLDSSKDTFMVAVNVDYPSEYTKYGFSFPDLIQEDKPEFKDLDYLKRLIVKTTTVGDSLTKGAYYSPEYNGAHIKENYPYFLQKLTGWDVVNVSESGATPISWWSKFGTTTDYATSDCVIIGLGTNGGLTDTISTDIDVANQTFANTNTGQYGRIINAFKKANPNVKIFLADVFVTSGAVSATNNVIQQLRVLFDCGKVDDSSLYGDVVMHPFGNGVHYGKVGNLEKANLYLQQILNQIETNKSSYETLIDTY